MYTYYELSYDLNTQKSNYKTTLLKLDGKYDENQDYIDLVSVNDDFDNLSVDKTEINQYRHHFSENQNRIFIYGTFSTAEAEDIEQIHNAVDRNPVSISYLYRVGSIIGENRWNIKDCTKCYIVYVPNDPYMYIYGDTFKHFTRKRNTYNYMNELGDDGKEYYYTLGYSVEDAKRKFDHLIKDKINELNKVFRASQS